MKKKFNYYNVFDVNFIIKALRPINQAKKLKQLQIKIIQTTH